MKERIFTRQELSKYNGEYRPEIFISYAGIVYDVSLSPKWRSGLHENLHFPGLDLTSELINAPHSEEVFSHPYVRKIGRLAD